MPELVVAVVCTGVAIAAITGIVAGTGRGCGARRTIFCMAGELTSFVSAVLLFIVKRRKCEANEVVAGSGGRGSGSWNLCHVVPVPAARAPHP